MNHPVQRRVISASRYFIMEKANLPFDWFGFSSLVSLNLSTDLLVWLKTKAKSTLAVGVCCRKDFRNKVFGYEKLTQYSLWSI